MIWNAITGIADTVLGGVMDHFKHKRELKEAKTKAKIKRLNSKQDHKQRWEIMQLENNGWQDDILFYFFIGMFILSGVYPSYAEQFFNNLGVAPDWFVKTWMYIVASVVGVKKLGDYGPKMVEGMKHAKNTVQAIKDEDSEKEHEGVISQTKEVTSDIVDSVTEDEEEPEQTEDPEYPTEPDTRRRRGR